MSAKMLSMQSSYLDPAEQPKRYISSCPENTSLKQKMWPLAVNDMSPYLHLDCEQDLPSNKEIRLSTKQECETRA